MRHTRFLFLLTIVAVLSMAFISCTKDDIKPVNTPTHELLDDYVKTIEEVSVVSDEIYTLDEVMSQVMNSGMFNDAGPMASQITNMIKSQMRDTLASWNRRFNLNASDVRVRCVKYTYRTVDHKGNPITLSSYATWAFPNISNPQSATIHNRLILFCPYSQTKEDFRATATCGGPASAMLTKDALIVSPDPQGFGHDSGHDQMYMNHELIGIQMADAMTAAYKIFMDAGFRLAGDFILTPMGMSQGAATSVATQRYLESTSLTLSSETRSLADWWQMGYTFVSSGPYSPEITMNEYLTWQTCAHPGVIPLVLKTMIQSYPQIYDGYTEDDFYSENYLAHKQFFDSVYLYKPYTIDEINALMFELISTPEHQMSNPNTMVLTDMISSALLDPASPLHQKMHQSLQRNDLTTGWTPRHNIYITASEMDDYVPFANAEALQQMNHNKVHLLTVEQGDHQATCLFWLLKAFTGAYDSQLER